MKLELKIELKPLDNGKWIAITPSGMEHTIGQSTNGKFYCKCEAGEVYNFDSLEDVLLYLWGLNI